MPYSTPLAMPKRSTGPATVKIFAPTPSIRPSDFVSIAGETTEFANPVTGTKVPAPAYFAILSKTPIPVKSAEIKISVMVTNKYEFFSLAPRLE